VVAFKFSGLPPRAPLPRPCRSPLRLSGLGSSHAYLVVIIATPSPSPWLSPSRHCHRHLPRLPVAVLVPVVIFTTAVGLSAIALVAAPRRAIAFTASSLFLAPRRPSLAPALAVGGRSHGMSGFFRAPYGL
jgi:hypothetical protein